MLRISVPKERADRGPRLDIIFERGYSKDIKYSRFFGGYKKYNDDGAV